MTPEGAAVPAELHGVVQSAPLRRLRHPQEESPLWGLACGAVGGSLALALSLPLLAAFLLLLPVALILRALVLRCWPSSPHDDDDKNIYRDFGEPEPLRGNDERWLGGQDAISHTVLVFDAGLSCGHLQELVTARVLTRYPRLSCRLVPNPGPKNASHCWRSVDPVFIEQHVFEAPNWTGGSEENLQRYVEGLLETPLDAEKPPWELHVLSAYGRHGDTAVVLRVHQCLADGMALVRVLCHALSDTRVLHVPQKPHFGGLTFSVNAVRALLVGPATLLAWFLLARNAPRRSVVATVAARAAQPWPTITISADVDLESQQEEQTTQLKVKRYSLSWSAGIALHKVVRIKHVTRATVNEVLLAGVAGAIRALLQGCGVRHPPDLKIVVPVDLRSDALCPEAHPRLGSKVAPVVMALPSGVEGSIPRLWAARKIMADLKTSAAPAISYLGSAALMKVLPSQWARKLLQEVQSNTSLQFSSLPGPPATVLVGGHPLKAVYTILPAPSCSGLAISVFTYADQVYVTALSEKSCQILTKELLQYLNHEIECMWNLLMYRRAPGEGRPANVVFKMTDATSPVEELQARLHEVQGEVASVSSTLRSKSEHPEDQDSPVADKKEEELTDKLDKLKSEFTQLLQEVRRRKSLLGDPGSASFFEDEEMGGELWRPRRRSAISFGSIPGLLGVPNSRPLSSASPDTSPPTSPELPRWEKAL
ncbi:uncharacterized protein LOC132200526 [Neocloeon triangulifer]|uniref:uncharacterized protein LOC132200526 n=1 Tax=Neocloeon triangulifer TaxID=2078957 RepID=UPI00286F2253|nr:uncharacterized protein LOC132200526 [Neocloeon triangulifer]